jgi:hypothetical protein
MVILAGASFAQKLTPQQISKINTQIIKLQKEVGRLNKKLAATKPKKDRGIIIDKIDANKSKLNKLKQQINPKPAVKRPPSPTFEAFPEATLEAEEKTGISSEAESRVRFYSRSKSEVGGVAGFFGGATAFLGEIRFSLGRVLGPATLSLRASTGLAQSKEMDRRFVPLNLDLLFSFPPGWFSGVENYLGVGLNYLVLTTGRRSGTVGGEAFYGIQSEGFGGMVFGEIGYAIMRTGFSASYKGVSVLAGYRKSLF